MPSVADWAAIAESRSATFLKAAELMVDRVMAAQTVAEVKRLGRVETTKTKT